MSTHVAVAALTRKRIKDRFMKDLDEIIAAEEEGHDDVAIEKHEKLKAKLEEDPKEEEG